MSETLSYTGASMDDLRREFEGKILALTHENEALKSALAETLQTYKQAKFNLEERIAALEAENLEMRNRHLDYLSEIAELKARLEQLTNPPRAVCEACGEATWDEEPKGWQVAHTPYKEQK